MANIKSEGAKTVFYSFDSKMPHPFQFKDILIDLNPSYASNLSHYMNYKYAVVKDESAPYKVSVVIDTCFIEIAEAGAQTVSVGAISRVVEGLTVTTTLTVKVRAEAGGKVTEEDITMVGEYTGNIENLSTGQISISMALEGSILLLDRFLNKVFGGGAEPVDEPIQSDI